MRFDQPDTLSAQLLPLAGAPRRPSRRKQATTIPLSHSLDFQPFPSWAVVEASASESAAGAFLAAGVGLAILDANVRQNAPTAAVWRQRLALQAAAASTKLLRLREDKQELRDAIHLAVSETFGPAGRIHALWRDLAAGNAKIGVDRVSTALSQVDGLQEVEASEVRDVVQRAAATPGDPVTASAQAATDVYGLHPGPEAEIIACWAADLVLAKRLRWNRPVPLLLSGLLKPVLRRGTTGRRPCPSEPHWLQAVASAYALASADAQGFSAQLARRGAILLEVWPRLRARRAEQAIALLLADDCVSPTRVARRAGLSDRAARRLFDRLVELDAVREVSGRPSFRLYGL